MNKVKELLQTEIKKILTNYFFEPMDVEARQRIEQDLMRSIRNAKIRNLCWHTVTISSIRHDSAEKYDSTVRVDVAYELGSDRTELAAPAQKRYISAFLMSQESQGVKPNQYPIGLRTCWEQ